MTSLGKATLHIENISIAGYAQPVMLRSYRPSPAGTLLPIVFYFHGGSFVGGSLDEAAIAAATIATSAHVWVISVGYSLAPAFPFPAALEDGYRAVQWAVKNAHLQGADAKRMGAAGHDAGGNLATCLCAVVRDRREFTFSAQALMAPLLDPSMTRIAEERSATHGDRTAIESAHGYRAYLRFVSQRLHPYAAPIESTRLQELPAALIASAGNDVLHVEAEKYSCELIAAGVPTAVTRYRDVSHNALATHPEALADVAAFFGEKLR